MDWNAWATGLGGKVNTSLMNADSNVDFVVDFGRTGSQWYEVRRSGEIWQGGETPTIGSGASYTVSLNTEMTSTNYNVSYTALGNYNSNPQADLVITNRTTTNFTMVNGMVGDRPFTWTVKGF
jgi:hypothetical protein